LIRKERWGERSESYDYPRLGASEINEAHQETMFTSTNFELIERELRSLKLETPRRRFSLS